MQPTHALPIWFVPLLVLGGLTFFVALWCGISLMIAQVGGYRSLAGFRSPGRGGEPLPRARITRFGAAAYKGHMVALTADPAGLGIHIPRLFIGHPDLRVPWDRVEVEAPGRVLLDGRVRMTVTAEVTAAITAARARLARGAGAPG